MSKDKPTLTFGSLFAGIGGIDLGLERAGMRCEWQVEIDEYATKVLAKHWPDVTRFRDVRSIGRHIGDIHTCYIPVSRVDVLAGGFPCQPHSQAGERKASSDERDLWPEFHRLIRELKPRWVVAENVLGLLSSEDGAFFGGVLRDLAQAGYDARWQVLSAAQFGAPHLRERVIIVAYHSGIGSGAWRTESAGQQRATIVNSDGPSDVANAYSNNGRWSQRAGAGSMACQGGAHTEGQGHSQWDAYQCGGSSLAYSGGPEWWASPERWGNVADWTNTGWEEAASGFEFRGEELAHTSGAGWEEWDASTVAGEQGYAPWRKIAPGLVADATSRRERQHQVTGGESGTQSLTEQSGSWSVESGLGRATYGLSSWLDGYRWPARPGQSQEAWEAPRVTVGKIINRSARLKGLGNAVVPALAEYVGRCIVAAEAERECVA